MKNFAVLAAAVAWCLPLAAQTPINGSRTFLGNLDSGAAASSRLVTGNGAPPSAKCNTAKAITSSTNASPIVITSTAHGFSNGDVVTVYGHTVNTAANSTWVVGSVTANTLALCGYWDGTACQNPSTGNGVGAATGFFSAQVGRLYFRNDATAGQNLYMCTDATGSPAWVQQLNSGGGGGGVADPGGNGLMARTALNTTVNRTITGTANHISVSNGDGVAGNPALDLPSGVALPNATMGTGYLSSTKTAGSTGVTANLLVKIDTTGNVVTAAAGDAGILGVALATVASGGAVEVALSGIVNCVADNTTVIGDALIVGTTTAGRCRDASGIGLATQVIGKALTVATAGNPVSVQLYGPGQYGTKLAVDSTPNLFAAGGGTAQAQTATYAPAVTALVNGLYACWLPAAANTAAAPTFAPNGLTAKPVTKLGASALAANDLTTTALACALYDGTEWQLQNPQTANAFAAIPQTATYQVLAADFALGKTIPVASGTFTITLVASGSQPASGQTLDIINYGSGVVTVARSGQNINGAAANLTIPAGSASAPTGMRIVSDGANYIAQTWGGSSGGSGVSALAGQGRFLYLSYSDSTGGAVGAGINKGRFIRFSVEGQLRFDHLVVTIVANQASSGLIIAVYSADRTTRRCNTNAVSGATAGKISLAVSGSDPDVTSGVCILPAGGYDMVFSSDNASLTVMALLDGNSGKTFDMMSLDSSNLSGDSTTTVTTGTGTGLTWTGSDLSAVTLNGLTGNRIVPLVWLHNGN